MSGTGASRALGTPSSTGASDGYAASDLERCACGMKRVLSRTGFGVVPNDPLVHAWAGCVVYRGDLQDLTARSAVEAALSVAGAVHG